jgi:hypothetical protein
MAWTILVVTAVGVPARMVVLGRGGRRCEGLVSVVARLGYRRSMRRMSRMARGMSEGTDNVGNHQHKRDGGCKQPRRPCFGGAVHPLQRCWATKWPL